MSDTAVLSTEPSSHGTVSPEVFELLREAIRKRRQLWQARRGRPLRMWPHAMGWRGGDLYVLGFILEAREQSASRWEWIRVAELQEPWMQEGIWIGSPRGHRPSSDFLDAVVVECDAENEA